MPTSVNAAFFELLKDKVNLDPDQTALARASRDWLLKQINSFTNRDESFPRLFPESNIFFGSFARRTKTRPLDDVDLMICLSAQGGNYVETETGAIRAHVPQGAPTLYSLCDPGTNVLNSRRVVNKFVSLLRTVPQYQKAEISRNQEAATLKLVSYDWCFDIVPCFLTAKDIFGNDSYLIPNGNGAWKKTDPRRDAERARALNVANSGRILNVIRLMKYWNKRPTMPSMPSYLLESMVLDYYDGHLFPSASEYVDVEIPKVLEHIRTNLFHPVNDPKGMQGDINKLSFEDRQKISKRAADDKQKALAALALENASDHKATLRFWKDIFGAEFPEYG